VNECSFVGGNPEKWMTEVTKYAHTKEAEEGCWVLCSSILMSHSSFHGIPPAWSLPFLIDLAFNPPVLPKT